MSKDNRALTLEEAVDAVGSKANHFVMYHPARTTSNGTPLVKLVRKDAQGAFAESGWVLYAPSRPPAGVTKKAKPTGKKTEAQTIEP